MIAANGVTARYPGGPRRAVAAPGAADTPEVGPDRRAGRAAVARTCPRAVRIGAQRVPRQAPASSIRRALPICRCASSSCWGGANTALDLPGQPIEGHFGLAVSDYTHSTAPNRRFPDLLDAAPAQSGADRTDRIDYSTDELRALAAHCTIQEDNAAKVERQVGKSAAALLLSRPHRRALRWRSSPAPRPREPGCASARPPPRARSCSGFEGLEVGDRVRVKLVHTDVERGFIDFERLAVTLHATEST